MFCYQLKNIVAVLHIATFAYVLLDCHTVANATGNQMSSPHTLTNDSLNLTHLKRDDFQAKELDNGNQTSVQDLSNSPVTPSQDVEVQTHSKPHFLENDFKDNLNSTASLPAFIRNINNGALLRTGFVALGFMLIIVAFFIIRAVRLRHKRSKSRKYGIITSTASDMEMEPLDKDDDEEEEATLFDAQHKYSLQ